MVAGRLRSGVLPALEELCLEGIPASEAARAAVYQAACVGRWEVVEGEAGEA